MTLPDSFTQISDRVRNWGRWGDDDQLGTLNFITSEVVKNAARCIRTGETFPLSITLEEEGVQVGFIPGRINPVLEMIAVNEPLDAEAGIENFHTSDDVVQMGMQAATHWDGLCHASYNGFIYNGYSAETITENEGATICGIENLRTVCSRGVLLDVARAKGVEILECPYAITAEDLEDAASLGNVEVKSGDIVLVRTGRMSIYESQGGMAYCLGPSGDGSNAGFSLSTVEWLHDHEVAAVANDTLAFEVYPSEDVPMAVHMLHLVDMGLTQGQNWNLESLAAACNDDGIYDFFLSATPEPFLGGVGSPVAPVAIR
ncbi:MAG: cyclase [Actinobacteria bacterium]|nr:cyclase [Actinomycetota bacterium]